MMHNQIVEVVLCIGVIKTQNYAYTHDDEVKPAPGICEITAQAVSYPFQKHLQQKDVGEYPVSILQDNSHSFSLMQVNIFKCLEFRKQFLKQFAKFH